MINPCYECTIRTQICHAGCDKYVSWCNYMAERKKVIDRNIRAISDADSFKVDMIYKTR
ncbi:MAG: hypothetical protein ACTSPI_10330 [Candidatus Heimdallarchaeaceae archaeon]